MQLVTEVFGDVVVLHTPQDLSDQAGGLLRGFSQRQDQTKVVADIDETERLDSDGLEALLELQQELRLRDGDLRICTANQILRKIFEITRLDQKFEVYESILAAVKSFD